MKKLPRDTNRSKIIVRLSEKNKEDFTKIEILRNLEKFFGVRYHKEYDDWDWNKFSSIGFSPGNTNDVLVGTIRTQKIYLDYIFMDYDSIIVDGEFEEFQKFSREQHPDNKSFDKGLI